MPLSVDQQSASYSDDEELSPGGNQCSTGTITKNAWTPGEDVILIEVVHKYGPQRWSMVASHLPGRVGKQCRERWFNHLCPEVKKGDWTPEEDRLITDAVAEMGTRWSEIVKRLPGRTDNAIKNRYNSNARRQNRLAAAGATKPSTAPILKRSASEADKDSWPSVSSGAKRSRSAGAHTDSPTTEKQPAISSRRENHQRNRIMQLATQLALSDGTGERDRIIDQLASEFRIGPKSLENKNLSAQETSLLAASLGLSLPASPSGGAEMPSPTDLDAFMQGRRFSSRRGGKPSGKGQEGKEGKERKEGNAPAQLGGSKAPASSSHALLSDASSSDPPLTLAEYARQVACKATPEMLASVRRPAGGAKEYPRSSNGLRRPGARLQQLQLPREKSELSDLRLGPPSAGASLKEEEEEEMEEMGALSGDALQESLNLLPLDDFDVDDLMRKGQEMTGQMETTEEEDLEDNLHLQALPSPSAEWFAATFASPKLNEAPRDWLQTI